MPEHTCHAKHCPKAVPRKMFMCRKHWFTLPKPMRDSIWAEYNPGQEQGKAPVTREYLDVANECIKYVWNKEQAARDV